MPFSEDLKGILPTCQLTSPLLLWLLITLEVVCLKSVNQNCFLFLDKTIAPKHVDS